MTGLATRSRRRRHIEIVGLTCWLAFAVTVLTLQVQSIWWDEGISLHLATLSWSEIVADRAANIHPPLYFFLLKAWTALTGATAFSGRYLSALAFALLPAAAARFVGRRAGRRAGELCALLVALAPPFIIYGGELRTYALLPLGVLALWSLAWPVQGGATSRVAWVTRGICLAAVQATLLLLHYAGAIAIAAAAVIYAVTTLGDAPSKGRASERIAAWLLGMGLTALFVGPWAAMVVRMGGRGLTQQAGLGNVFATPAPVAYVASLIAMFHTTGLPNAVGDGLLVRPTALLGGLMALALARACLRQGRRLGPHRTLVAGGRTCDDALLRGLVVWLVPFLSAPFLWWLSPQSHPRYLFPFVLGGWLVVGLLVADRRVGRLVRHALLATTLTVSLLGMLAYLTDPAYARSDIRAVAAHLRATARPGDVVVVPHTDWSLPAYDLGPAEVVMSPPTFMWETDAAKLAAALPRDAVVFVMDYGRGAVDPGRGLRAALAGAGVLTSRVGFSGVSLESYVMREPPAPMPCQPLPRACLTGSDLCVVGAALHPEPLSGAALAVRVCWQGGEPASRYGVALRLYSEEGVLVARHDEILVNDRAQPSDLWAWGDHASYHVAPLPVGLLPLPYRLELGLFDWTEPSREVRWVDVHGTMVNSLDVGAVSPATSPWLDVSLYGLTMPSDAPIGPIVEGITLESARLDRNQVAPGERIYVTSQWRLLTPPAEATRLELSLVREGTILSTASAGRIAADWPVGRPLMFSAPLMVPADVAPGVADVVISIGERRMELGEVEVRATDHLFTVPMIGYTLEAGVGQVASLVAVDLDGSSVEYEAGAVMPPVVEVRAGTPLTLTLVWRAGTGAADRDWKVFAHLAADGRIVAQHDAVPVAWSRPTTGWIEGEVLVDQHPLAWEAEEFVGNARLVVGFYDPDSGERLLWDDGHDALVLPMSIEIHP